MEPRRLIPHAPRSFTRRQVSDAIPIPGLLDMLGPAVQAARSVQPGQFGGLLPPSPTALLAAATSFMPASLRDLVDEGGRLSRAALALEQLGSVAGEVGDGTTAFTPSPSEGRRLVARAYSVPRTLLVR